MMFPTIVFPYCVYKFSLKRLWGSPITFTILPITIKDFPCNFIVVSLCIVFPYYFYKHGMYFPRKSLQTFTVWACIAYSFGKQSIHVQRNGSVQIHYLVNVSRLGLKHYVKHRKKKRPNTVINCFWVLNPFFSYEHQLSELPSEQAMN